MMKKSLIMMICLLTGLAANIRAASHWSVNPYDFQHDMTVYVTVIKNGNPVSQLTDYEIAAFCGDECRGVATVQTAEKDGNETVYGYLRIRSNQQSGEAITFRVYDRQADKEFDVENTSLIFQLQEVVGLPSDPLILAVVLKGDVNGDGAITAQDALLVLQLEAKKVGPTDDGIVYETADVNGDGKVTAQDASLILQYLTGKVNW